MLHFLVLFQTCPAPSRMSDMHCQQLSTHKPTLFPICPKRNVLSPCRASPCQPTSPGLCGGLLLAVLSHSTLEDRSLRTLECHILFCLMGEIQGVLVSSRTKAQLCQAAHKVGHLWRLPPSPLSDSGGVLIMSPASVT